jgi:integrase
MRNERGFFPRTVEVRSWIVSEFLGWCDQTNRQLKDLRPEDIDAYFVNQSPGRWSRTTVAVAASALRGFLGYAERCGLCTVRLAASIGRPRLYRDESLPYAPDWADVQRMLADVDTDKALDIRDRAILLLLAVYGLRSGEVAALRLDQIDWDNGTLRIFRLKRRQPQIYPLVSSAAEAIKRYIDTVRPPVIVSGSIPVHPSTTAPLKGM